MIQGFRKRLEPMPVVVHVVVQADAATSVDGYVPPWAPSSAPRPFGAIEFACKPQLCRPFHFVCSLPTAFEADNATAPRAFIVSLLQERIAQLRCVVVWCGAV